MQFSISKTNANKRHTVSLLAFLSLMILPFGICYVNDTLINILIICAASVALTWLVASDTLLNGILASLSAWAITLILSKSAFVSAIAVIPTVYGLFIGLSRRKKTSLPAAIALSSLTLTVSALSVIVTVTVIKTGRLDLISITESFPGFFDMIKNVLYDSFYIKIADVDVQLITPIDVQEYLNVIIALIPGVISAMFTVAAYIVNWLYSILEASVKTLIRHRKSNRIIPSLLTTLFFVTAALISSFSETFNVLTLTGTNITLIFLPMFIISGIASAFELIETNGFVRPRLLRPFILIIAFMNDIASFVIVSAIFAIYDSIKLYIKKKYSEA